MSILSTIRATLPRFVLLCSTRRLTVLALAFITAVASVVAAGHWLGVSTDTSKLFSNTLPWKQASQRMMHNFPQNDSLLVAVIDARIPEEAEATAAALATALRARPDLFRAVTRPDSSPYLEQNAFLLIGQNDLTSLLERTVDAQPFLGQLVADPSMRGLFGALGLVAEGEKRGIDAASLTPALAQFHATLASAADGHAEALSWERLLAGGMSAEEGKYRFVTTKPKLNFGALEPGGVAHSAMHEIAATLPFVRSGEAHVRITGSVALDDEEFASVAQGAAIGLGVSFLFVLAWLFAAVRSWRLMLPIAITLVLGLVLTTGFAAVAVGTLNLISVAFAILFVGIAVDFAIQFTVRFRDCRHSQPDMVQALEETARRSGAQILIAALATACGFLAFTPTQFTGVAQLGVIAGGGMLIAFLCTLSVLPALLVLFEPKLENNEVGIEALARLEPAVAPFHWPIVIVFAVLALAGAGLVPFIPFDGDPLHTKNQHTEAVEALNDLKSNPLTSPYTIDALMPSLTQAAAMADRLAKLPDVSGVLSLNSFFPMHQTEKLAEIADAGSILGPSLTPPATVPALSAADLRTAVQTLDTKLQALFATKAGQMPAAAGLRTLQGDLDRLRSAPDAVLLAANQALIGFLPVQLARLRLALSAKQITLADVPADLRQAWMLPDGSARIEVLPGAKVDNSAAIRRFVDTVQTVLPDATGSAVWIVRSAQTIIHAFSIAALSAILAIALILAVALRRALDVSLVMAPLLISSLLTVVVLMAAGISLNFANIIALPLLLGVGVSFNIYFVMNWRAGSTQFLGSATARAVIFSALTTGTAFGSLALSQHPGTASMGLLLVISLVCTVVTTLVFLPALLGVVPAPKEEKESLLF